MPTSDRVAVLVEDLERLASAQTSVDALHGPIGNLLRLAPRSIGTILPPGAKLYRATKHHRAHPESLSDLWYPPPHRASLGRANRDKIPVFYCASDPNCALGEIGASAGDLVVCATWTTTEALAVHDLGYTRQVLSRTGLRAVPSYHEDFYESLNDLEREVRDYFAGAFTRFGTAGYRLSAAIAEAHVDRRTWRNDAIIADSQTPRAALAGIMYPALSRDLRVDNVALLPWAVRSGLRLTEANLVEVINAQVEGDFELELRNLAVLCGVEYGSLTWTAAAPVESIPPGGRKILVQGESQRFYEAAEIDVQGNRYQVHPGFTIERTLEDRVVVRDLQGDLVSPRA